MTISDSTLATDVWDDVRSALVAASIVTTVGATTTAANITNVYPDKVITKPQIVINPIQNSREFSFGSTYGKSVINVVIECYSDKTIAVDQLRNQVNAALLANNIAGINLIETSEDYAFNSPGENKMHLVTLVFTYERTSHA